MTGYSAKGLTQNVEASVLQLTKDATKAVADMRTIKDALNDENTTEEGR